jgi:hypothetical protein
VQTIPWFVHQQPRVRVWQLLLGFFRELSDLVAAGPPSPHARLEIAERYGVEFAEPSRLPDIIERYNLTPPPG